MNLPDGTSQTFTNLYDPQVASFALYGLKQTPKTVSLWPLLISNAGWPSAAVKTLTSPSSVGAPPPVTRYLPSGEYASATTRSEKPVIFCLGADFSISQRVTSWKLPVASVLPSGLNAIDSTSEMCAASTVLPAGSLSEGSSSVFLCSPLSASYRWTWLPRPVATSVLSGLMATPRTGLTSAGGKPTTTFGFSRTPIGALAPWSIQSLTRASSCGVSGSSFLGGMIGSGPDLRAAIV